MSRYYVTAVIAVEADCANTAVNAVAIAVLANDVDTPQCRATLIGLDLEGEPILEVFAQVGGDGDGSSDVELVSPEAWTLESLS